jgi:predicted site-specific integrase-resolvase
MKNPQTSQDIIQAEGGTPKFGYSFGYNLPVQIGIRKEYGSDTVVLGKTFEDELVKDMLTLMASFSAKIYGKRSHQNRKKKEAEAPKESEV